MITFKQFINEEQMDLLTILERDCGPFLRESKHRGLLHRGINGLKQNDARKVENPITDGTILYWEKAVRTDRQPMDFGIDQHSELDKWFNDKFGFKARSQAVFCFGDDVWSGVMKQYGPEYLIFPIGEFEYVWSPEIKDLFMAAQGEMYYYQDDVSYEDRKKHTSLELYMNAQGYKSTGLDKAVTMRNEIMIKCDKYYAFSIEDSDAIRIMLGLSVD